MKKNYDYVLQQNSTDCGIASIMTILMYYRIRPSREKILSKISKQERGYSAYDLIKISKMYGIEASGVKTKLLSIEKFPVIAHIIKNKNLFHFIVIFEIDKQKKLLKVMDPAEGIKTITFKEFEEITTDVFIIFNGKKKKKYSNQRFKKELIKIFQTNRRIILKTLFLSVLYVILSLIFNYYLKIILTYNKINVLILIFIIFINITFLKNIVNYLKNRLILKISKKIDQDITIKVSNHVLNLPYEYFISKTTGELVTIVEDVENFKEIVTKIFILSAVDLILIGVILLYICFLNFYVGLTLIIVVLALLFITKKYQHVFNDLYLKYKISKINYTSKLINYLTAFETIKNLNIISKISVNLSEDYNKSLTEDFAYNKKINNYNFLTNLFVDSFYLIFIFLSLCIVIKNKLELFDVVLFSSLFYFLIGLLTNITESISLYKVYESSTERVLDCLDVEEEKFLMTNLSVINSIKFKNVKYDNNCSCILNDINLEIKKGEKIYITGESGLGKSTMMKILLRYFKSASGEILIDNLNINDLDLSFIRKNITYIGQNEELFPGTIMDNLKLVEEKDSKIYKASRITLLDKTLRENNVDYNFLVEESGTNLSGGERKKLILTRGLLHFKNVLILDEVFNEISIEEEKEILTNLFNSYSDKIIIVISHRNNNLELFDKKYKLEGDGKLYEFE